MTHTSFERSTSNLELRIASWGLVRICDSRKRSPSPGPLPRGEGEARTVPGSRDFGATRAECAIHGFFRGCGLRDDWFDCSAAGQLPGVQAKNRNTQFQREGNYGEGAKFASDGNYGLGRAHDQYVARLAEAARNGDVHGGVGFCADGSWKNAEGESAGGFCAATGGLHHAAQSAADHDGTGPGEATADLLGESGGLRIALSGADDGDGASVSFFVHSLNFFRRTGEGPKRVCID